MFWQWLGSSYLTNLTTNDSYKAWRKYKNNYSQVVRTNESKNILEGEGHLEEGKTLGEFPILKVLSLERESQSVLCRVAKPGLKKNV